MPGIEGRERPPAEGLPVLVLVVAVQALSHYLTD